MTGRRVTSGRELTDVELQVVQWLPMPLSFTDIGHRLGMRGPAVRALAVALYRRLGVASRHDAYTISARFARAGKVTLRLRFARNQLAPGRTFRILVDTMGHGGAVATARLDVVAP